MDKDRIRQKLKDTPLITGLKIYNTNSSVWAVPRVGSHGHKKLMNAIPSKKNKPESDEVREELYRMARSLGYKFE